MLVALLKIHGTSLNDKSPQTLLVEVEAIGNTESLSDIHNPVPLWPMQLLTITSRVVMPSPVEFQKEDIYFRTLWKRAQHLANEFWSRWKIVQLCKFVKNETKLEEYLMLEALFCYGRKRVGTSGEWVD